MKRCYYVLFLCLSVFMLFTSVSYCSMSTDTKNTIYSQCQILNEKGMISGATLEYINTKLFNTNTFNGSNYGNDYFIFIGKGSRYNGGGHRYSILPGNLSIYIGCCQTGVTSIINRTTDVNTGLYTNWGNVWSSIRCNVNNKTDFSEGSFGFNDALDGFYCYTTLPINTTLLSLGAGEEFGGSYLVYNGPEFVPIDSVNVNVYHNGSLVDIAKRLDFGYVFPKTSSLGYLTNYDQYIQGFEAYFGPVVYFSGDNGAITDGTQSSFKYDLYTGTYTNGLLFDFSTGEIRVDSSRLIENQCYFLSISYQEDFRGDWVYLSPDVSYYALKYTTGPVTSGDAISPYLDTTIDIGFINSVNDILNNNPNKDYYYNNSLHFSGDFWDPSGDVFGIQYRQYDHFGLHSFIKSVFNTFIQILTNFNDISVNVGVLGVWNSADFFMPQNAFYSLISLICNGLLCLYGGFALYRYFNMITTFDLDSLTKSSDVMNWF